MKYVSTRQQSPALSFSDAILKGLAPDGGLYVPESWPVWKNDDLQDLVDLEWDELAAKVLAPFLAGDKLSSQLPDICRQAFNFPVPLMALKDDTFLLELFHGPTCAFKDVGARFLAECVTRLQLPQPQSVIVATSGDTGGAVAAAFFGKPRIDVTILYPKGRISERQEKQLTTWGGNIAAIAIEGDFDECQRQVKERLSAEGKKAEKILLSANSINLGRLLPQMVYYAYSSLQFGKRSRGTGPVASIGAVGASIGSEPLAGLIIPSGNLGNSVAAFWAKKIGFPIREIVLATNANTTVPDFFTNGTYLPHPTRATLANAMDVGDPSNMERLRDLYPRMQDLRAIARSFSVNDDEIRETIRTGPQKWKQIFCPHTATAMHVREQQLRNEKNWIVVATAHPAKFEGIVEPLIGAPVPVPPPLAEILARC